MSILKKSLLFSAGLSLAGCMTASMPPKPYPLKVFYEPALNETHEVNMGEKMLMTGFGYRAECFTAKKEFRDSSGFGMVQQSVLRGETLCKKYEDSDFYWTDRKNTVAGGSIVSNPIQVLPSDNPGDVRVCFHGCEIFRKNEYSLDNNWVLEPSSFQQTIEYVGQSKDQIYFTYSETQSGMARPAFTRDFQLDSSEGSTLNYKGAVIEIINATNESISYKVIIPFKGK